MLYPWAMIITCPACATRYDLPDGAIGAEGRTVRCANCRESWFEPGEGGVTAAEHPSPIAEQRTGEAGAADLPPQTTEPFDPAPPAAPAPVFDRLPLVAPAAASAPVTPSVPAPVPVASPEGDNGRSSFAYEPPFVPRRRRLRAWLLALLAFVLLLAALAATLAWYGAPDWLPFGHRTFAKAKPGLVLDFPKDRIERRTLADGTEFFGARGTITNTGSSRQSVPPLLIVLRDRQRREVYRWEVIPPKPQLGPGETMTINQAVTDIPRSAIVPEIGWKSV
jgi:predicted Zn finger-like uncharacterized protein